MPQLDLGKVKGEGVPEGGEKGQVLTKRSGADYDTEWTAGAFVPEISVTTYPGAVVKCSKGEEEMSTEAVIGACLFSIPEYGVWTVSATLEGKEVSKKEVNVSSVTRYAVELKYYRFGYKVKIAEPSPANRVEYLFDAVGMTPAHMDYDRGVYDFGSWGDVWFVRKNYPVMLRSNGTEDYKLDPNNYARKLTDGSASDVANTAYDGNAMSAIPLSWVKRWEENGYRCVVVSNGPYDETYRADAHTRADGTIEEVHYYPMFKGSIVNGKLRSLSGQYPQYKTTATQERDAAKQNGEKWDLRTWSMDELIADLLLLMNKTTDSQGANGQGQTSGYVDNEGQHYGHIMSGTLNDKGPFWGANDTTHQVKVFNIEGFWGGRWDRFLGLLFINGVFKGKMTPQNGGYNFTGDGYTSICNGPSGTNGGFQKATKQTELGCLPIGDLSGSDSTYECDACWYNNSGVIVCLRGGTCDDGSKCGARFLDANNAASVAIWPLGGSLSCESPS